MLVTWCSLSADESSVSSTQPAKISHLGVTWRPASELCLMQLYRNLTHDPQHVPHQGPPYKRGGPSTHHHSLTNFLVGCSLQFCFAQRGDHCQPPPSSTTVEKVNLWLPFPVSVEKVNLWLHPTSLPNSCNLCQLSSPNSLERNSPDSPLLAFFLTPFL